MERASLFTNDNSTLPLVRRMLFFRRTGKKSFTFGENTMKTIIAAALMGTMFAGVAYADQMMSGTVLARL